MYYWGNSYNLMRAYSEWLNAQMTYAKGLYEATVLQDYGPEPFVFNVEDFVERNNNFRTILWTGNNMQLALMSIKPGEDIGLEIHPDGDQFIFIEEGLGFIMMGDSMDNLNFKERVNDGNAFLIPAGKWHNFINIGDEPLKILTIYAPPEHPFGTIQKTKKDV